MDISFMTVTMNVRFSRSSCAPVKCNRWALEGGTPLSLINEYNFKEIEGRSERRMANVRKVGWNVLSA